MTKEPLYWNQSLQDNVIETLMLLLTLAFLAYVLKLAFFEPDGPDASCHPYPPDEPEQPPPGGQPG